METLKLYLSPTDAKGFNIIDTKSGETKSSLPFFEGEKDWRTTILRCLEMTVFNSQYFQAEEQEWMVKAGILNKNSNAFDDKYLVKIGQEAYQALFPKDSKAINTLLASLRLCEDKNIQLHIQLVFEADVGKRSRLADYPWELVHDGEKFLLHHNVTISRFIAYDSVPPKLPPTNKVNVLLVSSVAWDSELGLKQLGEQETQAIRKGLEKASNAGHINFVELEDATRDKLRAYLTEHRDEDAPHVLHFDGHGLFGKRCSNPKCRTMHNGNKAQKCRKCDWVLPEPQGYLVFEDEDKKADYFSAQELGVLLRQSSLGDDSNQTSGIALVVLSACQSGMALDGDSVFNGTAQNLISHRIPSVVAMQYSVEVKSATQFAQQFYRSLGQKNSLGIAINQARETMGIEGNQWYRPVLYLRWEDNEGGQLFKSSSILFPTDKLQREITGNTKELEYPNGLVPLNSPFYIKDHGIESLCYETLVKPSSLIRIKSPKLMGKTSLLIRIRYHGENQNYRVSYLDLGGVEKAVFSNLDTFLRWFCGKVSDELNLNNQVNDAWNTNILGSNDNCTAYFNKHILAQLNSPLVLILDEVDRLFLHENPEMVKDFFGMLRSWHEKGKFNDTWKKLRLVLAHSTEAYITLDIHQSPFNVGVPVELEEFNQQQVEDLARRHPITESDALTEKLMSMVGGHPYLLRLAMYHIATGKVTLEDLLNSATTEAGIYSNHLRSLLEILQRKPKLAQALKKVVDSSVPVGLDSMQIYQLHSLGLVQRQKNEVTPRCKLYREYFHRVL